MWELSISVEAESELSDIWFYLWERSGSIETADGVLADFRDAFKTLCEFPRLGRVRKEFDPDTRSFVVEPYVIFYQLAGGVVRITHVVHGRRDLAALFPPQS